LTSEPITSSAPDREETAKRLARKLILHSTRTALLRAPHAGCIIFRRFDDRLAAHLDGLAIAGEQAKPTCQASLEQTAAGAVLSRQCVPWTVRIRCGSSI
jgi:hypothetical protein